MADTSAAVGAAATGRPAPGDDDVDLLAVGSPRREEILERVSQVVADSGLMLSVHDIADACGLVPGSLYHHFDSKEAIVIELVRRYKRALRAVADAEADQGDADDATTRERVIRFASSIADCAMRNRAAVLATLYEPPIGASDELVAAVHEPAGILPTMQAILAQGAERGELDGTIDHAVLADRICQSMLHHAMGHSLRSPGARQAPMLRCQILLDGLAAVAVADEVLDRSVPLRAVRAFCDCWVEETTDRAAEIRRAARTEFGRRGYRATTMRHIAAAAGIGVGTVYRAYPSKRELLEALMAPLNEARATGWRLVAEADSTSALEKLDAFAYLNVALAQHYGDELRLRLSLLRERPSDLRRFGSTAEERRQLKEMIVAGERTGELRLEGADVDLLVKCTYELLETTDRVLRHAGMEGAHALIRQTVVRGALHRATNPSRPAGLGSRRGTGKPTGVAAGNR